MNAGRTGAVGEIAGGWRSWTLMEGCPHRGARHPVSATAGGFSVCGSSPGRLRLAFGATDQVFDRIKTFNEAPGDPALGRADLLLHLRNPRNGEKAARLLEQAGMKGAREGDALFGARQLHDQRGQATAAALRLIERGRESVRPPSGGACARSQDVGCLMPERAGTGEDGRGVPGRNPRAGSFAANGRGRGLGPPPAGVRGQGDRH